MKRTCWQVKILLFMGFTRGVEAPQPVKVGALQWKVRHGSKPRSKEVRFFPSPRVCLLYLL